MVSYNKVILMGNLTRDPELRYTANGTAVAGFGLAVNRKFQLEGTWKEEVCFVDITVWGKQAENCSQYLSKGRAVLIDGRLNYRTWETDEGQKRSKLEVVATTVQFLSRGKEQESHGEGEFPPPGDDDIPF